MPACVQQTAVVLIQRAGSMLEETGLGLCRGSRAWLRQSQRARRAGSALRLRNLATLSQVTGVVTAQTYGPLKIVPNTCQAESRRPFTKSRT